MKNPSVNTALSDLSIVIPVYNAIEETLDCVLSLLASDAGQCLIWLMDDASDWGVQEQLETTFKDYPNVNIISHFRNRGYTRNISEGIEQTFTNYVCVLNSDTLLPPIWATPIVEKMRNSSQLGGIGPLSNAASYQSVPFIFDLVEDEFSVNDGLGFDKDERADISNAIAHLGQNKFLDVPILNGFCTVFRRSALNAVGGLDFIGYPDGYGEENDLCVRLKAEGYRLCVSLGTFVHHQKSKSFGLERKKVLSKKGALTLAKKFGPELVPSLAAKYEQLKGLKAMRTMVQTYLETTTGHMSAKQTLTSDMNKLSLDLDTHDTYFVKLCGGGSYTITPEMIIPTGVGDIKKTHLSTVDNGIEITLPHGSDISILSTAPIATTLIALSLLSSEQMIYIGRWCPTDQSESMGCQQDKVGWPVNWRMPEAIDVLDFQRLWLSNK